MYKKLWLLFVCLFYFSLAQLYASTLHMIIVAETDDYQLGAVIDYERVQQQAKTITELADMKLSVYRFKKASLSALYLKNQLENIRCGYDDVIWFYYAGHGFNSPKGNGRFPGMAIGNSQFPQESIHRLLKTKGARLVITLFDCCNYASQLSTLVTIPAPNKRGYRKLFRQASGSIKIASNTAGPQSYSFSSPEEGGIFTSCFLQSIEHTTSLPLYKCTWENLLIQARANTNTLANVHGRSQIPYYELQLHY